MMPNMKFSSVIALFVFFLNLPEVSNEQQWVKNLTKYLKKDVQVFQTVLIVSEDAQMGDKEISHITKQIQEEFPSQVISLRHLNTLGTKINASSLLYLSFEKTTLFITIPLLKENLQQLHATDTTDYFNQLSTPKTRPKCLMIALPKKGKLSYRTLLKNMWSNYFLDFTILEIAENPVENSGLLRNQDQFITTVNNFNPFNGIYTEQKYTRKIQLFKNKLLDLNGFEMRVGSIHFPPHVYVKRNLSGYPVEVSGPDALVAKTLSKKMNFRLSEFPSQEEWFGKMHCNDKNQHSGFVKLLGNNIIRFVTNHAGMLPNCEIGGVASKSVGSIKVCALVPIRTPKNDTVSDISRTTKWIYLALLVFIIRILTILLKFDNDVWPWFEILRGSFGFTVPREPSRLAERIAFVSILMAFCTFSSNIFAMLTDTTLTKRTEKNIDTLEELNRTNLIPTMTAVYLYVISAVNDPVFRALAAKSSVVSKNEECIDMLVQGKNVACVFRESVALIAIAEHRDANNYPVMKIVKERLWVSRQAMHFEPNSPFIDRVDAIILRLIQSGLTYYWENQFMPPERISNRWETDEEPDSVGIVIPLTFFVTFGCSLSIIVFICELLLKYVHNHIHGCVLFTQDSVF